MFQLQVGQLILDKYGRLAMIIAIDLEPPPEAESLLEIEWLNLKHGKTLMLKSKVYELRQNFISFRSLLINHGKSL